VLIDTNAIVLKCFPYGDTSLICRIFTEEQGKVTIIAKGVRKSKKSTFSILEPTNHIHVNYYYKHTREIQILKDAIFIQHHSSIRRELNRIVIALTIVEILDKVTKANNPQPLIYRLGWRVIDKLNDINQNQWIIFIFFMYHLSLRVGFMPNLINCAKCNMIMYNGGVDLLYGEIVCENCIIEKNNICCLSEIKNIIAHHLDDLNKLNLNKTKIYNTIKLMELFLSHHIQELKNLKAINMLYFSINQIY